MTTPDFRRPPDVIVADKVPATWDELLDADPGADFFHTAGWSVAACAHYPQLEPVWLVATSGDRAEGGLVGLRRPGRIPLLGKTDHLESSLEGTSGGPIVREDLPVARQEEVFRVLLDTFLSRRRGAFNTVAVSLNTNHERRFGHLLRGDPRWRRRDVPGAVIDLSGGVEQVEMTRMKKTKRNEKNRGLRRGVEVFTTNDLQWLRRYYHIYQAASRKWEITAVPLAFLEDLLKADEERAFFTCVTLEDEVIGGHLNLVFGDRVIAWNGVTDPAYARSHFPATIAVWWDIVESCRRGARWLDLGASGGVTTLSGFKKYFGAELETRGFYVNDSGGMRLLRRGRDLLAHWRSFLAPVPQSRRWHDDASASPGRTGKSESGVESPGNGDDHGKAEDA